MGLFKLVHFRQKGPNVILSRKSCQVPQKANIRRMIVVDQRNVLASKILECQWLGDFGPYFELGTHEECFGGCESSVQKKKRQHQIGEQQEWRLHRSTLPLCPSAEGEGIHQSIDRCSCAIRIVKIYGKLLTRTFPSMPSSNESMMNESLIDSVVAVLRMQYETYFFIFRSHSSS